MDAGDLNLMIDYVLRTTSPGNASNLIRSIDAFMNEYDGFTMHIGAQKGEIVDELLAELQPQNILDCGTYFGYSAIRMAGLTSAANTRIISIDYEHVYIEAAQKLIAHAELQSRIDVCLSSVDDALVKLKQGSSRGFDLVLLDHYASFYIKDLRKLEQLGLLNDGAVVIADNAIFHEKELAAYLHHVRESGFYQSRLHTCRSSHHNNKLDGMEVSYWLDNQGKRPRLLLRRSLTD